MAERLLNLDLVVTEGKYSRLNRCDEDMLLDADQNGGVVGTPSKRKRDRRSSISPDKKRIKTAE